MSKLFDKYMEKMDPHEKHHRVIMVNTWGTCKIEALRLLKDDMKKRYAEEAWRVEGNRIDEILEDL